MKIQSLLLMGCLLNVTGRAGVPGDNPLKDAVDAAVQEGAAGFMSDSNHVGLSIGIIADKNERSYDYGETARGSGILPSSRTIYEIGSITKTFTGLLMAHAFSEKKMSPSDDVRKYLKGDYPNLQYSNSHPVELIYIIAHLAQLPRTVAKSFDADFSASDFDRELKAIRLGAWQEHARHYEYSNFGYQILGVALENAFGKSYDELLHKFITGPLGMNSTKVNLSAKEDKLMATGYGLGGTNAAALPPIYPAAGGIHSTVRDMLKYLRFQMAEEDANVRMTHRMTFASWEEDAYGFQWYMGRNTSGDFYLRNTGGTKGFSSYVVLYPDRNVGIVLLANEADDTTQAQLHAVAMRIFPALARQ